MTSCLGVVGMVPSPGRGDVIVALWRHPQIAEEVTNGYN